MPLLFTWFCQPHVAQLWPEPQTWKEFEAKWLEHAKKDYKFIVYVEGKPFAYVQYYQVTDKDHANFTGVDIPDQSIGLDLFIADPQLLGKGYGTQLLQQFIAFVRRTVPACKAIIIDPAVDNHRAIACYQKVGFVTLGTYVMPYGTINGPGLILLMMYAI